MLRVYIVHKTLHQDVSRRSRAVTKNNVPNVRCKLLCLGIKPIAFSTFLLPLTSRLLKIPEIQLNCEVTFVLRVSQGNV